MRKTRFLFCFFFDGVEGRKSESTLEQSSVFSFLFFFLCKIVWPTQTNG